MKNLTMVLDSERSANSEVSPDLYSVRMGALYCSDRDLQLAHILPEGLVTNCYIFPRSNTTAHILLCLNKELLIFKLKYFCTALNFKKNLLVQNNYK